MADKHGVAMIEALVNESKKNKEGDLEISLKVNNLSNIPSLNAEEKNVLIESLQNINSLIYPILEDEEFPSLSYGNKIKAGIPYSTSILRNNNFVLNNICVNYLAIIENNKVIEEYFPLEM